jgi:1,4-dihydroxy-2-naphthoate octaprenyltransferase
VTASLGSGLVLAARPKTLTAAVVPVVVGTALAPALGHPVIWGRAGLALVGAGAIQIGTNLFNDLLDFRRGADTVHRVGPMRVTQAGILTPAEVRAAALACFAVALACGIPLVAAAGWPILVLGLLSLLFGYAYTGGPYPLAYHGLGEPFVLAFFGLGAVGGTFYLHAGRVAWPVALAGTQVGLLACALLAINNLRDVDEDRRSGKHTLAARRGLAFGRGEVAVCAVGPLALNPVWLATGDGLAALLPLAALPLALAAVRVVFRDPPGPSYNRALARAAGLQLAFGALLALGLML